MPRAALRPGCSRPPRVPGRGSTRSSSLYPASRPLTMSDSTRSHKLHDSGEDRPGPARSRPPRATRGQLGPGRRGTRCGSRAGDSEQTRIGAGPSGQRAAAHAGGEPCRLSGTRPRATGGRLMSRPPRPIRHRGPARTHARSRTASGGGGGFGSVWPGSAAPLLTRMLYNVLGGNAGRTGLSQSGRSLAGALRWWLWSFTRLDSTETSLI